MHCLYNSQKDQTLVDQIFKNFCSKDFIFQFVKLIDQIAIQKLKILNHVNLYIQHKV